MPGIGRAVEPRLLPRENGEWLPHRETRHGESACADLSVVEQCWVEECLLHPFCHCFGTSIFESHRRLPQ